MIAKLKSKIFFLSLLSMSIAFTGCEDDEVGPNPPPPGPPTANSNILSGNIDKKTVLKNHANGVDYEICSYINVNAELIIEPGVEIMMCPNARISVGQNGSLHAVGTSGSPITIRGKVSTPGYWEFIEINSNNPANVLDYVIIADGGGRSSYDHASIWVNDNNTGQLTVKNSTVRNSKGYGIVVENGADLPNFSNNTFSNNGGAPAYIPFSIIGAMDEASNFADGNYDNHVSIFGTSMNKPQTVNKLNVPYYVSGKTTLNEALKLNPGVDFLMGPGAYIYVNSSGSFNAIGTAAEKISITGKIKTVGYWEYIEINSNNPLNKFRNVTISHGGGRSSYQYSTIWVNDNNNGTFDMSGCSLTDSYGYGVYVERGASMSPSSAAAVEAANTFSNNGAGSNANCGSNCNVYFP